jgi:hypothetical protein
MPCRWHRYCALLLTLSGVSALQAVVGAVLRNGSDSISVDPTKRDDAAKSCDVAVAVYAGFVVVSLGCIFLPAILCKQKKEADESLEDQYRIR